jgi:soluble lytic murein transglycosylase
MEGIRAAGRDLEGHPSKAARWQIVYPWAYAGTINEEARKNRIDPYLVHALIREESRYFPMALSRSNAIGLMQLLPGTAFGVAKRIGLAISSKDEIFIPENNIKMGTAYLAYTLGRFDGQAMLAVASYNGGPNAVKHWVDQFHAKGLSDWDIFVENIPFRETRDYVRKVFGSYWTYETIYQ